MNVRFYNYVLSGNCYKFRLLASLLAFEYESVAVDFHPGAEHKSEDFLQINPAGTLPILQAGDQVMTETQAMLVWLAEHHDEDKTWWPSHDSEAIVNVVQWLGFASRLTATVGELRLHTMLNKQIDVTATRAGAIQVLRELETHLAHQQIRGQCWLAAETPTIADIACFPYTALSPDAGIEHDAYPAIRCWLYAVRSLDGFITMPGIHELHENRGAGQAGKTEAGKTDIDKSEAGVEAS